MAQIPCHVLYQGSDVLLLRAAARSLDSASVPWPDPADSEGLRTWLVKAWEDPVLREAVALPPVSPADGLSVCPGVRRAAAEVECQCRSLVFYLAAGGDGLETGGRTGA